MATAVLYNFVRGRNDPIDEESLEDPNEHPLPAMSDQGLALGNATRRDRIYRDQRLSARIARGISWPAIKVF